MCTSQEALKLCGLWLVLRFFGSFLQPIRCFNDANVESIIDSFVEFRDTLETLPISCENFRLFELSSVGADCSHRPLLGFPIVACLSAVSCACTASWIKCIGWESRTTMAAGRCCTATVTSATQTSSAWTIVTTSASFPASCSSFKAFK